MPPLRSGGLSWRELAARDHRAPFTKTQRQDLRTAEGRYRRCDQTWTNHSTAGYFKMFTARATTNNAITSDIASSTIISSLAQDLIAETSVGLNAVAVVNERWR